MYQVLIVEDDPMVAMINESYVQKHKQFVVAGSCRNGQAALAFLEDHEADSETPTGGGCNHGHCR